MLDWNKPTAKKKEKQMTELKGLARYWAEVRAGLRPRPKKGERKPKTTRRLRCNSSWCRSGELLVTLYERAGEIGFREPGKRVQYRLGIAEAYRSAVLITTARIARRVRELRKDGQGRGATAKARREILAVQA